MRADHQAPYGRIQTPLRITNAFSRAHIHRVWESPGGCAATIRKCESAKRLRKCEKPLSEISFFSPPRASAAAAAWRWPSRGAQRSLTLKRHTPSSSDDSSSSVLCASKAIACERCPVPQKWPRSLKFMRPRKIRSNRVGGGCSSGGGSMASRCRAA